MHNRFIFSFVFTMVGAICFGQSTREATAPQPPAPMYQATKKSESKFLIFKKKNKKKDYYDDFVNRMKANSKQKKKDAKMAEKPQYNNPLYFGHKKPPKKRPLGKRKFCKECLLKH